MTPNDMRATLEAELLWRQNEYAFFKNLMCNLDSEEEREKYRKSLILILYSHFEGFIKISLLSYIQYINSLELCRKQVNSSLIVASMRKEFVAYDNLDRKCKVFSKDLPDDSKLHRYSRRIDLIDQMDDFLSVSLNVDDNVIDTESNLWYIVLKKNLYKIGIPIDIFSDYESDINRLVNRRNSIAHGNIRSGVTEHEFKEIENNTLSTINAVIRVLYDYANNRKFEKQNSN